MQLEKLTNDLAKSTLGPFGAHASNAFIYSLICGGFISFGLFITINLILIFKIWKIIKINKFNLNNNYILISSIFIILF